MPASGQDLRDSARTQGQKSGGCGGGRSRSACSADCLDNSSGSSWHSTSPFRMVQCHPSQWASEDAAAATVGLNAPPLLPPPAGKSAAEASGDHDGEGGGGSVQYSQMPMRAFMAQKDWRELLTKRDTGKLAKCKSSGNKYNRMLYSYHRLYQEYQYLCTCLLPGSRSGGGSRCSDELLIGLAAPTDQDSGAGAGESAGRTDGSGGGSQPTEASDTAAFGSVLMSDSNFKVQRCKKRRSVVCHRVWTRIADGGAAWMDVPVAVELLLPRLQEQIKAVISACPHVSDPLEVLAELRANRYDTGRCIGYLRETLPLREVVRDILSVRSARCLKAQPAAVSDAAAAAAAVDVPLLRGVRLLKQDLRLVRTSLRSVATAVAAGLGKVRCHLSVQQERARRLGRDGGASAAQQQAAAVSRMQKCVEELRLKCKEEESRRRLVFNALQEQLGNIRVYCRCTRIDGDQSVETIGGETVRVRGQQQQDEFFRFDRVFGPDAPQEKLFEELQPLITSFLDGYNICFITYGGEASGKTFTLLGSSKQRGLIYRALITLLSEAASRSADWALDLDCTCMEIYNDACFDLLAERSAVSLCKDCSFDSVFTTLRRVPIREEKDVLELLRACSLRRRVAKTALNPRSSRSHLVQLVRLQARSRLHGHSACSYLAMMDLAGAENIVKADTWREPDRAAEAGHINRSLAAFNRLFLTLRRTPPSAACYREARLTQMLKPFLVNHGKCCIIVTVRTDQASVSTTMSTLRFGRDTRKVALGKAQRQLPMGD